jgi:hypothetical protein
MDGEAVSAKSLLSGMPTMPSCIAPTAMEALPQERLGVRFPGPTHPGLRYWELAAGNDLLLDIQAYSADMEEYRARMNAADFVVAAEPGNGLTAAFRPAGRVEGAPLKLVRSLSNFSCLQRFPLCTKELLRFRPRLAVSTLSRRSGTSGRRKALPAFGSCPGSDGTCFDPRAQRWIGLAPRPRA